MRRRFRGIVLLILAAWMCGLTYLVIYYPGLFLGERAGAQPIASEQKPVSEPVQEAPEPTESAEEPDKNERTIVVAANDIEWGTVLESEMLTDATVLKDSLPEGFIEYEKLDQVVGQILMVDLKADKPLLRYKLHRDQERLIEERTEEGKRAMAVKVDDVVGVSGYIKPYSRVDVLVTLRRNPPVTRTVLRSVLVLAAGPKVDRVSNTVSEQVRGEKKGPSKVNVVTLQVSPEEAEKLALASSEGKLRLALRNPRDKEDGQARGVTLNTLLSSGKPSRGRRAPAKKVVVIKGSKVETQTFR